MVHGPHESAGGCQVLTVQSWQSRDGQFDFHIAEGDVAATPARGSQQDLQARAPAGEGGETGAAIASEGVPGTDDAAKPAARQATEESLGRGYG